jgi:DNA-binding transcriptional regulator YdaS (Cro superfamily)
MLLCSNNNNRNRVETAQNTFALAAAVAAAADAALSITSRGNENVNENENGNGNENGLGGTQRVRSVFPTTEESRRRRYRSQCDFEGYTDRGLSKESEVLEVSKSLLIDETAISATGTDTDTLDTLGALKPLKEQQVESSQSLNAVHALSGSTAASAGVHTEELSPTDITTQSTATETPLNNLVEPKQSTPVSPTKAELENEFNNINPVSQSEGERYEERIVQLQSAPLPCIDAVTGLVHIVGKADHLSFPMKCNAIHYDMMLR